MSPWGHLEERFGTERPLRRRGRAGGGIRGVLSLEILAEIERKIAARAGVTRLGDYFDYIGGTSTGAIIAAGLSIGMTAAELLDFYREAGVSMFEKNALLKRLKSFYTDEPLAARLQAIFREEDGRHANLTSERLRCLLLVVTRNMTTDSPWPISSNPLAKYNDRARPDCNCRIPLWQLVRASTAAPTGTPPPARFLHRVSGWRSWGRRRTPWGSARSGDAGCCPAGRPSTARRRPGSRR